MGLSGLEPPTSRLSGVRSNRLSYKPIWSSAVQLSLTALGGDKRDRTVDLLLAKQALSQLSYTPNYLVVHSGVLPSFISSLKALFCLPPTSLPSSGVSFDSPASLRAFPHPCFRAGLVSRFNLEGPSKLNNVLKCFLVMPDLGFRSVLQPIVSP